jgi:hypothetical protein
LHAGKLYEIQWFQRALYPGVMGAERRSSPGPVSRRAEEVKVNMQSIKGVNSAPAAMDFDFNKAMVSEESGRAAGAAGCRENRAHAVDSCQALVWGAV